MMVVPVLMTSCQVSEKWNRGPVTPHRTTISSAATKVIGWPAAAEIRVAMSSNIRRTGPVTPMQ